MIVLKTGALFICCSPWFYTLVLLLWKRWHNSFVSQGDSWYPDKSNFDIKYFSPGGSKSKSDKSMWSLASPLVDKYWLLINWVGVTPNLSNFDIQYLSPQTSKSKSKKWVNHFGASLLANTHYTVGRTRVSTDWSIFEIWQKRRTTGEPLHRSTHTDWSSQSAS